MGGGRRELVTAVWGQRSSTRSRGCAGRAGLSPISSQLWVFLQRRSRCHCKHEDKFLNLPVLFHLPLEGLIFERTIKNGNGSADVLV